MIFDKIESFLERNLFDQNEIINEALMSLNASTEEGETKLLGDDIILRVMSYWTKEKDDPGIILESHRKYIDIQTSLIGEEGMNLYFADQLTVTSKYNHELERTEYDTNSEPCGRINVGPGQFILFLENDAHMPQLLVKAKKKIKKAVIKVNKKLFRGNK